MVCVSDEDSFKDEYDVSRSFQAANRVEETPWCVVYPIAWKPVLARPDIIEMFFNVFFILQTYLVRDTKSSGSKAVCRIAVVNA